MGLSINTNINLLRYMRTSYESGLLMQNSMKRLSSGIKINSASDDAAGLSLSQKMKMNINSNSIAKNNAQTGIAMLNTADSAIDGMVKSLQRVRDLAVQSANGVYSASERVMLQEEAAQLSSDVKQTYASTKFGSKNVFKGDKGFSPIEYDAAIVAGFDDAHIITSAADFRTKISADLAGRFVMVGDLDMSELGVLNNSVITGDFTGHLDGKGHSISNLSINTGGAAVDNIGLFSHFAVGVNNPADPTVQDLNLEGFSITAIGSNEVGGLVGKSEVWNTIKNVVGSGNISGQERVGGIAGYITGSNIYNSEFSGSVHCEWDQAGGIAGRLEWSQIYNSKSSGAVSGNDVWAVGGLVGTTLDSQVSESSSSSSVSAGALGNAAGGLIGDSDGSVITNVTTDCYATGSVSGGDANGGLIGSIRGFVYLTSSYATGSVSGATNVGGLVGDKEAGTSIDGTNFYKNNMSSDAAGSAAVNANLFAAPTGPWSSAVWDKSGVLPQLKDCGANLTPVTGVPVKLQVGTDSDVSSQVGGMQPFTLGAVDFDISNQTTAQLSIDQLDAKISELNLSRSNIGASINRLQGIMNIQDNRQINYSNANSTIKDSDMAQESALLIKTQILQNASATLYSSVKNLDKDLALGLLNSL